MRPLPKFNILFSRWYTNRKCKKIDFLKSDLSYNPLNERKNFMFSNFIPFISSEKNTIDFFNSFSWCKIDNFEKSTVGESRQPWVIFQFTFFFGQVDNKE